MANHYDTNERINKAMGDLVQAIGAAADAATIGRTRYGVAVNSLSGLTIAEAKAILPGSIVKLNDGSWALVPVASGVVLAGDGVSWLLAIKNKDGRSTRHNIDWLSDNVKFIIPGVLTVDGKTGPKGRHSLSGVGATLELVPADPIEKGRIAVGGGLLEPEDIDRCIDKLGLQRQARPWGDGEVVPEVLTGGGLPALEDARGAEVRTIELHGGGPLGALISAKLISVCSTLPARMPAVEAAGLICEFAGVGRDALELIMFGQAADAAAVRREGAAHAMELLAARDAVRSAFGAVLGLVSDETVLRAQAVVDNLASQGQFKQWAQVGAALRSAIDLDGAGAPVPAPAPPPAPDTPRTAIAVTPDARACAPARHRAECASLFPRTSTPPYVS